MDLSRDFAAPLTTYGVVKENTDDLTTNRGISCKSSARRVDERAVAKQVVSDSGIGFSKLNRWIQQVRRNPRTPTVQSDLEREITELRKEHRMLREESEV